MLPVAWGRLRHEGIYPVCRSFRGCTDAASRQPRCLDIACRHAAAQQRPTTTATATTEQQQVISTARPRGRDQGRRTDHTGTRYPGFAAVLSTRSTVQRSLTHIRPGLANPTSHARKSSDYAYQCSDCAAHYELRQELQRRHRMLLQHLAPGGPPRQS